MISAPAGQADWNTVVWKLIPSYYREKDAENNGYLSLLVEAFAETFWDLHEKAKYLPTLKNAFLVEGGFTEISFTVLSTELVTASESEDGLPYWIITVEETEDLLSVCPGWHYSGLRKGLIRSVSAIAGTITIAGLEQPADETIVTVHAPSMLEYLAKDNGVEIDFHEPETYQRNLVARASYWQAKRGTEQGILLRAKMAGFNATVHQLYWITEAIYNALPSANAFEIPSGSGKYYTDLTPSFAHFDTLSADVMPLDTMPAVYTETVTVNTVTVADNQYTLELSSASTGMVGVDADWKLTRGDRSYYVDRFEDTTVYVTSLDEVPESGEYTLSYEPRINPTYSWRPAHGVRVDLEIIEPARLLEPLFLENALTRLIAKLNRSVAAHVTVAQVAFTLNPVTVLSLQRSVVGYLRQYARFDEVEADSQPLDYYEETEL